MRRRRLDKEDRLEQHYRRLGTHEPQCRSCGVSDVLCLEKHHIAGRRFHGLTVIECRNCHRKLSDDQLDNPPYEPGAPIDQQTVIGRFLLGLCDLLILIVETLRAFGHWLVTGSSRTEAAK